MNLLHSDQEVCTLLLWRYYCINQRISIMKGKISLRTKISKSSDVSAKYDLKVTFDVEDYF